MDGPRQLGVIEVPDGEHTVALLCDESGALILQILDGNVEAAERTREVLAEVHIGRSGDLGAVLGALSGFIGRAMTTPEFIQRLSRLQALEPLSEDRPQPSSKKDRW